MSLFAPPPDLEPAKLTAAFDLIHNAVLWLARVSRSYAEHDAPPVLAWDADATRFTTSEIAAGTRIELRLPSLIFQFVDGGQPTPYPLDVDDKSSAEIEAWLLIELLHRDFDRERFSKALPYEIQRSMAGDEAKYSTEAHAAELAYWTSVLAGASGVVVRLQGSNQADLVCRPETLSIDSPDGNVSFVPGASGLADAAFVVAGKSALRLDEIIQAGMSEDAVAEALNARMR